MQGFFGALPRRLFLGVMLLGSAFIALESLAYFDFEMLPPFVIEKLPVRFESLWMASLRAHVAAAIVSFPSCLVLMTRFLQRRPVAHRMLGRATGLLLVFVLVPSGAVLAFEAKGGALVTAGFLLSGAIVGWGTVSGVVAARRRDFVAHRRAMRHVVAQMSVAVTSRALMLGLDAWGMEPELAYVIALWVPVLASAAVAELVSPRALVSKLPPVLTLERIRREISPLALPVRVRSVGRPFARLGR